MRHSSCRSLLLAGERSAAVVAHLDLCAECAGLARRLEGVGALAATLGPDTAPAGLAGRVLVAVRSAGATAGAGAPGSPVRRGLGGAVRLRRRVALATAAVAAAGVVAVAAGLATRGGGGSDDGSGRALVNALLTAASTTAATGSARFDLTGTANFAVRDTAGVGPSPSVALLPCALALSSPFTRGTPGPTPTAQVVFGGGGILCIGPHGTLPAGESVVSLRLAASGEARFPDQQHVAGAISSETPTTARGGRFEMSVAGDRVWVRQPDGSWRSAPGPVGPLGTALLDVHAVADLVSHGRNVADLGTSTLDGVPVHSYAFVSAERIHGGLEQLVMVQAWIGVSDHLVHRLVVAANGVGRDGAAQSSWHADVTVRLHDFGVPGTVAVPEDGQVTGTLAVPTGTGALFYPLNGSVALLTDGDR